MTPKKEKALAALLTSPTVKAAAQETGVGSRTMRLYLKDPEFLAEYKKRCSSLLEDATNKAKQPCRLLLSVFPLLLWTMRSRHSIRLRRAVHCANTA